MPTGIAWTDETWNPATGCSHVSAGCEHCYAETLSLRRGWSAKPWTAPNATENVVLHPERLERPLRWTKPRRIFVNSMSDLFHERIPTEYIADVFAVMAVARQHTFQVLTKRPERMRDLSNDGDFREEVDQAMARRGGPRGWCAVETEEWPLPNVWLGVSIEQDRWVGRADALRATAASVRFISAEPLLEPLPGLDLTGIHWLIIGGESGHRDDSRLLVAPTRVFYAAEGKTRVEWRPKIEAEGWVRDLILKAQDAGAATFFKQWGGPLPTSGGRALYGAVWDQYPDGRGGIEEAVP